MRRSPNLPLLCVCVVLGYSISVGECHCPEAELRSTDFRVGAGSFGPVYVLDNTPGNSIGDNYVGDKPMNDYDTTYDRYLEKSDYVNAPPYDERTARQTEEEQD